MSLIDNYLNQVAQKKTLTLWTLYNGLSAATLVLTGTVPAVTFRCKITLSASDTHTDCAGTVMVNAETLTFTAAATKVTTTNLTALPTITTANIDCNVKITCIDTGGADIYSVTYTDFDCRWEDVQVAYVNSSGSWTQSNAKVIAKAAYVVNDTIRKYGTTTEYPIKKVMTGPNLAGIEEYRVFML